ncbi:membrane-spanning 4-domains subfamily A member 4A [Salminus brasiliensis]|uniref:membrane-spanning 4-domains subfamily A member 4A n=1 Tax=Salminus brasiliensis TaxID=930266 RepID=UPI003B8331AE
MATSVTTAAHGVRVVTHIIPLETSEPPGPIESKEIKDIPNTPYMTRMFLRGEPIALGTVQVFIGAVMMALGTITLLSDTLQGEIPIVLGISYIICGSVTLAAHKGTSPRLIKSTLALNIIGSLLALSGICYFSYALAIVPDLDGCGDDYWTCLQITWELRDLILGLKIFLLVLSMLELCVCITLTVFSCKASHQALMTELVVQVQTAVPVCQSSHEPLLKGGE